MPKCQACGADLVFAINMDTGKKVPVVLWPKPDDVDANRAYCYVVSASHEKCRKATEADVEEYLEAGQANPYTLPRLGISHFRTCTDPSRFNKPKAVAK